jgi:hypothetical protein
VAFAFAMRNCIIDLLGFFGLLGWELFVTLLDLVLEKTAPCDYCASFATT